MNIKNQVCSFEQALKFKELGVVQASFFTWMEALLTQDGGKTFPCITRPNTGEWDDYVIGQQLPDWWDREDFETDREVSAFNASELLWMNNQTITINHLQCASPAIHLADHILHRIETGELTISEINIILSIDVNNE